MAPPAIKMLKLEKTVKHSSCLLHVVISIVTTVFPVVILELLDARAGPRPPKLSINITVPTRLVSSSFSSSCLSFFFFFETDLNGKVLPLLVTIGQHLLQHTRRNVSKHLVHRWTLRSVAFIETALSAILQASFIGILLCRRHFLSHSRGS